MLLLILVMAQMLLPSWLIQAAVVTPKLTITPAMSSVPSDGRYHPAFFVSVDDGKGKPYPLTKTLNVTISSSDDSVLSVPQMVGLTPASYFYVVNASSSVVAAAKVEVTVSASGYQSAKATISTGPPAGSPTALAVTVLPNVLLPEVGAKADLLVTLVDGYGNPTTARRDISIAIFSSDTHVASLASGSVVIPEGSYTAKTTLTTTGDQGSTIITASTANLKSATGTLTVTGPQPVKISLWALKKLPVGDGSNILFVGITDSNSNPVKLQSPITVNLYSSNPNVVSVQSVVTIIAGQWSAIVPLNVHLSSGTSTLTAASQDLDTATISVSGSPISYLKIAALKLYSIANSFPADGPNQQAMFVQCLDKFGIPTKTNGSIAGLDFYSDNTDIAQPVLHSSIAYGRSGALVSVSTKLPGTATVTVGSSSYGTTTANLKSYAPIPDKVVILTPPIPTEGEVEACLITMAGNNPVKVPQNTILQLTSSDTLVGSSDLDSIMVSQKTYLKYFKVVGRTPGQFSLTVSASGMPSTKITFSVLDNKPSTFKLYSPKPMVGYEFPVVIQMGNSGGSPYVTSEPVTVNIVVSNASNILVPSSTTINGDMTEQIFNAEGLGIKATTLTISSPGFKSTTMSLTPTLSLIQMLLNVNSRMPINKQTEVQLRLRVGTNPVEGASVYWSGSGLAQSTSLTDANGVATNNFTLLQNAETIEAKVKVGVGYLTATRTITSVPDAYHVVVTSNAPIDTSASGTYAFGDRIYIEAPLTTPMPNVLGFLGGKYVFTQWTGTVSTTSNIVSFTIDGDNTELSLQANYTTDYTVLIIVVVTIVVVSVIGFFLYRRYKVQLMELLNRDKEKKPPNLAVKPSPEKR